MKIVMIASEATPFAKTGGLADVLGALPKALARIGHEVAVFLPFYRTIDAERHHIEPIGCTVAVRSQGKMRKATIYRTKIENLTYYFIKNDGYFGRKELYQDHTGDYPDNAQRFAFFARAALDALLALGLEPDVIHAHDWQGALALYTAQTRFRDNPVIARAKRVLTIHNIGYQGIFPKSIIPAIDLDASDFTIDRLEFYDKLNFLKGGIIAADAVTTVSTNHAAEILTEEYGFGLEGVLAERKDRLSGILNGLDEDAWDPNFDHFIAQNYSEYDLTGKEACKEALQNDFGLPARSSTPLIGMVGRLTSQKGLDLLCEALPAIMQGDVQLVILGTGEEKYHKLLKSAAADFPTAMRVELGFDETLAHKIEAGSDFFLMPSLYEPCGINQMISMKYGTIPIVRATGGLADTVSQFDTRTWKGNGFSFTDPTPEALTRSVQEGLNVWRQPVLRNKLIKNAMEMDFSWAHIAEEYLDLYRRI